MVRDGRPETGGRGARDSHQHLLDLAERQRLGHLPAGLVGLVFAAIFAASMNSISAEINALTSTTVVDVLKRMPFGGWTDRTDLVVSRLVTLGWAGFAVLFAEFVSGLGTLVEAVNILGSLFYGTVLGIFLTAFWLERVGGTAVFVGALCGAILWKR